MNYIYIPTGEYPLTEGQVRQRFPQTSFPAGGFTPPDDYAAVATTAPPTFDQSTHSVREAAPAQSDGWHQVWEVYALSAEQVAANQVAAAAQVLAEAKSARYEQVNAITVTTPIGVFDGNEDAQRRMTSAITAMDDGDTLPWVLHDNTIVVVNKADLRLALRMAGAAMAAIWVAPYTQP